MPAAPAFIFSRIYFHSIESRWVDVKITHGHAAPMTASPARMRDRASSITTRGKTIRCHPKTTTEFIAAKIGFAKTKTEFAVTTHGSGNATTEFAATTNGFAKTTTKFPTATHGYAKFTTEFSAPMTVFPTFNGIRPKNSVSGPESTKNQATRAKKLPAG